MERSVLLIGCGMDADRTMTVQAREELQSCDCLIGAPRLLEGAQLPHFACSRNHEIVKVLQENAQYRRVGVLLSGDPGFFSAADGLVKELADFDVEVFPAVSSLSYFCAKMKRPWQDVHVVSMHGRDGNAVAAVAQHRDVFVLTGGCNCAAQVCRMLCEAGLDEVQVSVGENLAYENERISSGSARTLARRTFESLSVMLIHNDDPVALIPGIGDEEFIRAQVPMTKFEVRCASVAKLRVCETDVLYDIGAGTGSVAVELATHATRGSVYAIEKNAQAVELIRQNKAKFRAYPVRVIEGSAPQALTDLPAPDGVFIGGSGGNLDEIFTVILEKNPRACIVVNAIALETLEQARRCFEAHGIQPEITQISAARVRSVGAYHMMTGQNPVFVVSGKANGEFRMYDAE